MTLNVCIESAFAVEVGIELHLVDMLLNPVGFGALTEARDRKLVPLAKGSNTFALAIDVTNLAIGSYVCNLTVTKPFVNVLDSFDGFAQFDLLSSNPLSGIHLKQAYGSGSVEIPLREV